MKRVALALGSSVGLLTVVSVNGAQAQPSANAESTALYIVQTVGTPLAAYQGTNARRHREQLAHSREQLWATVQGGQKVYDYDTAFNGFAARLTRAQAAGLRQKTGVMHVWKSQPRKLETMSTPTFLGLTGDNGVWQRQYGGDHRAGEGVIIGVVDSGFWPENPSFAALPEPRPDAAIIAQKWKGSCDPGADLPQNNVRCNNKVIGARYFRASTEPLVDEFNSPRDYAGHGSHTTSTAAGNHGVDVVVGGTSRGKVSGMAPAARIAVYKACFVNFCEEADSVAAINQAVADGVDVINYSISGARDTVVDPIEIAFYNAARTGVFVATSAGNSGPGTSAVAHNSPWLTTVAAGRHDRASTATVTLGNGTVLTGSGLAEALPQKDLVLSDNVGLAGAPITRVQQCYPGQLDPAKATGKIVACATGGASLVNKSVAVQQAGGAGMIIYNVNPNHDETVSVFYRVPTVQVRNADLATLTAYAATSGAKAALSSGRQYVQRAPVVATFSSTGPAVAGGGDLLKPDITAPGVDVVAAVAPPGNAGLNHQSYQGTSMASPHIAGIAALVMGKHPTWPPSWVKSALMTTATQTDNAGRPITRGHGSTEATPFDLGAGHVLAERAFDPGLVYAATPRDWVSYMCALGQGQQIGQDCAGVPTIDPSDLNYPTIAVGDLAGTQTVHRRLTNTTGKEVRYTSTVVAPPGTTVTVTPSKLLIPAGGSVAVQLRITRTDAPLGAYTFGSLTWNDDLGHQVRSPIAVRPVPTGGPLPATPR